MPLGTRTAILSVGSLGKACRCARRLGRQSEKIMFHDRGCRPPAFWFLIPLLALAACDAQQGDGWRKRTDGSPARLGDTQDCHVEARRQAEAQYPPQRIGTPGRDITVQNRDLFPAEISFFKECMRRKGFER